VHGLSWTGSRATVKFVPLGPVILFDSQQREGWLWRVGGIVQYGLDDPLMLEGIHSDWFELALWEISGQ
jgi:hypothetical protein